MKTLVTRKSLSDASSDADQASHATARAIPESSPQPDGPVGDDFREEMRRRHTTPFVSAIPCHGWGLNE